MITGYIYKPGLIELRQPIRGAVLKDSWLKKKFESTGILRGNAELSIEKCSQEIGDVRKERYSFHGIRVVFMTADAEEEIVFWVFPVVKGYRIISEKMLADAGYTICTSAGAVA